MVFKNLENTPLHGLGEAYIEDSCRGAENYGTTQQLASGYMPGDVLLNQTSWSSEVNIGTSSFSTISSGTCSSASDAMNLALIEIAIKRGASGGAAYVNLLVVYGGAGIYVNLLIRIDADMDYFYHKFLVPIDESGYNILLEGMAVADSVYLQGKIKVTQFKKHLH